MDKLTKRIINPDKWPCISNLDNLEIINNIADNSFELGTFEGKFAALLMYHQIIEAMIIHLIEDCHFFIQLCIYPAKINFKKHDNKMAGYYLIELQDTMNFDNKDDFISMVEDFNLLRNNIVHKMTKSNIDELSPKLDHVKEEFDKIFDLYNYIQDKFRLDFHSFRKDEFADRLDNDN